MPKKPAKLSLIQKLSRTFVFLFSQKWTPWLIALLFITNALYVALLYRFSLIYDEAFHFATIKAFSNFLSPIIINQPESYDELGSLTFGSASIYHYLLSFPYRLISSMTSDMYTQVVIFRTINVLFAASGVLLYYRFFKELGIKKHLINIGLLAFCLLPLTSNVAANINYDNAIFPLTALLLTYAARFLFTRTPPATDTIRLLSVGLFASLIKFTFLPFFVAIVLFLLVARLRKTKRMRDSYKSIIQLFNTGWTKKTYIWSAVFILLVTIAGFRFGVATVLYGTPIPHCSNLMDEERCRKNPVYRINEDWLGTKEQRSTRDVAAYVSDWAVGMTRGFTFTGTNTLQATEGGSSPVILRATVNAGILLGLLLLLYAWRSMGLDSRYKMAIVCSFALLAVTMLFNMATYYKYNADINTQPRYAINVLPVLLVFSIVAFDYLTRRIQLVKLCTLITFLLIITQGGGLVTHALASKDTWYWEDKPLVQKIQIKTRNILHPLVKGE